MIMAFDDNVVRGLIYYKMLNGGYTTMIILDL